MKATKLNFIKNLFLGVFTILISTSSFAALSPSSSDKDSTDQEEFNVTDMIMHHIKDAHEFHILDWNGNKKILEEIEKASNKSY